MLSTLILVAVQGLKVWVRIAELKILFLLLIVNSKFGFNHTGTALEGRTRGPFIN